MSIDSKVVVTGVDQNVQKQATPDHRIHELLAKRWSPYAFADRAVPDEDLRALFEAARWAASSYNEQPWSYIVATTANLEDFERLLSCLVEGMQRSGAGKHQLAIRRDRDFGVAQVGDWRGHEIGRLPLFAVRRSKNTKCPIRRDMPFPLAKHGKPMVLEANQVRERIMRRPVPDLPHFNKLNGFVGVPERAEQQQGRQCHRFMLAPFILTMTESSFQQAELLPQRVENLPVLTFPSWQLAPPIQM